MAPARRAVGDARAVSTKVSRLLLLIILYNDDPREIIFNLSNLLFSVPPHDREKSFPEPLFGLLFTLGDLFDNGDVNYIDYRVDSEGRVDGRGGT